MKVSKLVYIVFLLDISSFTSESREDTAAPAVPADAEGDISLRAACILGGGHGGKCPRDGGWGAWGTWGPCRGRCGSVGRRERRRACDNPRPDKRGAACTGLDTQTDTCTLQGCRVDEYERLVAGDELRAQQLELAKVVHSRFPALASKCFEAQCRWELVEQVLKGGAASYWIALHCVKHNVGCPVRGGWSPWSEWSECSADCGNGNRTRMRSCTNPPPAAPSLDCEGPSFCSRSCNSLACAEKLDGHWSEWSSWSECSVACGDGVKRRERQCLPGCLDDQVPLPRPRRHPISGSAAIEMAHKLARSVDADNRCMGPKFELSPCQQGPCDVDGGWSDWEEWTACSTTCGLGMQQRSRSCSRPMQSGGGQPCAGAVTEARRCFRMPCASVRHATAVFSGGGQLDYEAPATAHALLHLHLRFLPRKPSGHLAERSVPHGANVTLRLAAGWLVLAVKVAGCSGTIVSGEPVELHVWHEVMAVVVGQRISLRVDDSPEHLAARLSCQPPQSRLDAPMSIGRDFHGLVQFVAVNFRPLALQRDCQLGEQEPGFVPAASSSVQVERTTSDVEEGFRRLRKGDLIAMPCPDSAGPWKVEVSIRCDSDGLLVLLPGDSPAQHVAVTLANGRIALACANQAPALADVQVAHGDWVLVAIDSTGAIERGTCCRGPCDLGLTVNGGERVSLPGAHPCVGEMFLGAAPQAFQPEDGCTPLLEPLEGVVGTLEVDGTSRDLVDLPSAQLSGRRLSSHSICTAGSYVEVPTSPGQSVNLSAVYAAPGAGEDAERVSAYWLRLDTALNGTIPQEEGVKACDDGQTTRLRIEQTDCRDKLEGFYLAWVERCSGDRVLAAFGVVFETHDWTGVLGVGYLALGAASLLLSFLYLLFPIICFCCPPPIEEECECLLPECPTATTCPAYQPYTSERDSSETPHRREESARSSVRPSRRKRPPAPTQSESSKCQCSDSQPSLPSLPSSHLNGSDIECALITSDSNRRIRLPVTSVKFQKPGTVTLKVGGLPPLASDTYHSE